MKALDDITTLAEIKQYALAEAADAQRQCPAVYNDYMTAVNTADAYMQFAGTAIEISYVEMARQQIRIARSNWYTAGCAAPGSTVQAAQTSVVPPAASVQAGLGGGGIGTFLLVGAGVFGLLWLLDKKRKGGKKTSARRKTTRRRAPRRRRAARRRR